MADKPSNAVPPIEERVTGKTFYDRALTAMQDASANVLTQHPEVRSVVAILDYRDKLNDAGLPQMLWMGVDREGRIIGPVTPDAMYGAIKCTLNALAFMQQRAELIIAERRNALLAEQKKGEPSERTTAPAIPGAEYSPYVDDKDGISSGNKAGTV